MRLETGISARDRGAVCQRFSARAALLVTAGQAAGPGRGQADGRAISGFRFDGTPSVR